MVTREQITYEVHDNGGRPFTVIVASNDTDLPWTAIYQPLNVFDGNTILPNELYEYVFIGHEIIKKDQNVCLPCGYHIHMQLIQMVTLF